MLGHHSFLGEDCDVDKLVRLALSRIPISPCSPSLAASAVSFMMSSSSGFSTGFKRDSGASAYPLDTEFTKNDTATMHDRIRFNILLLLGFVFTIKNLFIK
jgi:hypothetical protein